MEEVNTEYGGYVVTAVLGEVGKEISIGLHVFLHHWQLLRQRHLFLHPGAALVNAHQLPAKG